MASDFEFVGTIDVKQIHAGLDSIEKRINTLSQQMTKSWTASGTTIRADVRKTTKRVRRDTENISKNFANLSKAQRLNIRQGAFALQRFGIQGSAAFGEIFASAGIAGVGIGAVIISVLALTKAFKALTSIAINTFKSITKQGVEAATQYEIAGAQFTAVMQGNEEAAEAVLNRVKKLSAEVGQNLVGVSRAFLPEVENLDQLEDILKIATALAQFQPEQGILGARIALQEFLSGETRSLRRRFEIPQTDIERIKEAFDTEGIGAAIDELNGFLDRTGRSLDDLSDTATVAFNRLREGWRQLLAIYGEPILEAAKDQAQDLQNTLTGLRPVLDSIALAFGEVVGKVADLIGQEINAFISDVDFDNILGFAGALSDAAEALGLMVDQMGLGESAAGGFNTVIELLTFRVFVLEGAFLRAALAFATLRANMSQPLAGSAGALGGISEALEINRDLVGEFVSLTGGPLKGLLFSLQGFLGVLEDSTRVGATIGGGFVDAKTDMDALTESVEEYLAKVERIQAGEDIFEVLSSGGPGESTDEADRILKRDADKKKLLDLEDELIEAEKESAEIRNDFTDKANNKRLAIDKRHERAVERAEQTAARRAIEIQRQKLDRLEDLQISYNGRINAIRQDIEDDEEDIARRNGRKVLQIEEDLVDDKIKIQEDFLRRLDEINRRFDFDQDEAARANDAITFLRLQRRRKFELNEARVGRDEDLEDADSGADSKRKKLQDTLEFELEDARIANSRKLRDLNIWLNAQTAAIDLWEEREEEKRVIRLDQQIEDALTAQNQQLADYVRWWLDMNIETNRSAGLLEDRAREMLTTITDIINRFPSLGNLIDPALFQRLGFGAKNRPTFRSSRNVSAGGLPPTPVATPAKGGGRLVPSPPTTVAVGPGPGPGPNIVPSPPTTVAVGPGPGSIQLNQARTLATQMATALGKPPHTFVAIQNAEYQTLLAMIRGFEQELDSNLPGFKHGGSVRRGKSVLVGEPLPGNRPNPEVFTPASDGTITPLSKIAAIISQGTQDRESFSPTDTTLRQMFFSPPFLGGATSQTTDNSTTVSVINPEVNTGLSPIEIAEIKQIYAQLRLEEMQV